MADWLTNKGAGPWEFAKQPIKVANAVWPFSKQGNKPTYNEGHEIATSDNPVWSVEPKNTQTPVTTTHNPCGYWTGTATPVPVVDPDPVVDVDFTFNPLTLIGVDVIEDKVYITHFNNGYGLLSWDGISEELVVVIEPEGATVTQGEPPKTIVAKGNELYCAVGKNYPLYRWISGSSWEVIDASAIISYIESFGSDNILVGGSTDLYLWQLNDVDTLVKLSTATPRYPAITRLLTYNTNTLYVGANTTQMQLLKYTNSNDLEDEAWFHTGSGRLYYMTVRGANLYGTGIGGNLFKHVIGSDDITQIADDYGATASPTRIITHNNSIFGVSYRGHMLKFNEVDAWELADETLLDVGVALPFIYDSNLYLVHAGGRIKSFGND